MKPANQPRTFKCQRCGYEWESRLPEPQMPRACPQCTSRRWNIKRNSATAQVKGKGAARGKGWT